MLTAKDFTKLGAGYLRARTPVEIFRMVEEAASLRIGFKLLTMLLLTSDGDEVQRIYTTDPVNYPVSGRERLGKTAWGQHVIVEQQPFLGADAEGVKWAFPGDYDLIRGLGLGATMNVPVVAKGRTLGTLNILGIEHAFDRRHLTDAIALAPYLSSSFLSYDT
ncbi:GAF domain-containing protein [Ancylobacter sp.]|uniref:GAF domain-containing protein n=1 Tax=Ancylobacter sp. TaxID=1872567 RepID=UPI003D113864